MCEIGEPCQIMRQRCQGKGRWSGEGNLCGTKEAAKRVGINQGEEIAEIKDKLSK